MTPRLRRIVPGLCLLLATAACKDDIVAPTMGLLDIDTGGTTGVQIFLNDELQGTDVAQLGPLDAGEYRVRVERECFGVAPSSEITVNIEAGRVATAAFSLAPREFGEIQISAVHEILASDVTGASIWLQSAGKFENTGVTTPGTLEVPCGEVTIAVRSAGFDEAMLQLQVDTGGTVAQHEVMLVPERKVLTEMFTYVTCPNCPPSVDELEVLLDRHPGLLIVEWHSVPNLPLFDMRWRDRELYYRPAGSTSYPAVVVQGGHLDGDRPILVGSQAAELALYGERIAAYLDQCGGDCPVAVVAEADFASDQVQITAHVKRRAGSVPGGVRVVYAVLEDEVESFGTDSPYSFVPRNVQEDVYSLPAEGAVQTTSATLALDPSWDAGSLNYLVFVYSESTGEILAVDGSRGAH